MFRIPMNTENYSESTKNHLSSNGIFSKDLQRCTFSKRFQNMLKIESSPCSTISIWLRKDIAWNVFRLLTWSEITQRNFCWDIGLFSVLVKRKHGMERKITNLKNGAILQMSWSPTSKTADLHPSELPVRWIRGRCTIHFSADPSNAELFISHDHCCTSAQYPRSDRWLVWWIDSADSWSIIFKYGEVHRENEWAVKSKVGAWRSEYVGSNTWDECSSSERSTAWSPRKLEKFINRDEGISDLWSGWIHEESLYWPIIPNHSSREWCFRRKGRIMQRVHVISWWPRFWTYWVDSEDRTPHRTQHTRICFSLRAVLHICHSCFTAHVSSNALALAPGLMNRVSILLFHMDWKPNRGSTATIPAAEPGLAEWPNSPRSQVMCPTLWSRFPAHKRR